MLNDRSKSVEHNYYNKLHTYIHVIAKSDCQIGMYIGSTGATVAAMIVESFHYGIFSRTFLHLYDVAVTQ